VTCCLVVCPQWEISGFGAGVCSVALVGPMPTSSHGALGESTESCRLALSPSPARRGCRTATSDPGLWRAAAARAAGEGTAEQRVGGVGFVGDEYPTTWISRRKNDFLPGTEQEITPFPALWVMGWAQAVVITVSFFVMINITLRKKLLLMKLCLIYEKIHM